RAPATPPRTPPPPPPHPTPKSTEGGGGERARLCQNVRFCGGPRHKGLRRHFPHPNLCIAPVWRMLRILAADQISVIVEWSKRGTSAIEPAFTTIALNARSAARAPATLHQAGFRELSQQLKFNIQGRPWRVTWLLILLLTRSFGSFLRQ